MQVRFEPLQREADARADETILDVARRANAPIGNSCGGVGICGRCRVRVLDGAEQIAPPTAIEKRTAIERSFETDERLACQAIVQGACSVTTGYW